MDHQTIASLIQIEDNVEDIFDYYLSEAIRSTLTDRSYEIVSTRLGITDGQPLTLEEIGDRFGVTRERIRQIESKSFQELSKLFKKESTIALKNLRSLLSIWITPNQEANPINIASLLLRMNKPHYLNLFVSLFYSSSEYKQKTKEVRSVFRQALIEQNNLNKSNETQKQIFDRLFNDVAWPETISKIDPDEFKLIEPKRLVNRDNNAITGQFFSNKNERTIEYESNIEYKFCMYLESLKDVKGYVQQPVKISYKINEFHRFYYPDFLVLFEDGRCVLVEIKARSQMMLYHNIIKYIALQRYCINKGFGYLIGENYSSINRLIYYNIDNAKLEAIKSKVYRNRINWSQFRTIREELSLTVTETNALILHSDLKLLTVPYSISKSNVSFQKFIKLHKDMTNNFHDIEGKGPVTSPNKSMKINKESVAKKNQLRGRPLNDYTRWTKKEEEILINNFKNGMTIDQLSSFHRRGEKGIRKRLIKHNLLTSNKDNVYSTVNGKIYNSIELINKLKEVNKYKSEIAYNSSQKKIIDRKNKLGLPINSHIKWTIEEEELLIKRFNENLSIKEIAELHARNPGGIRARLKKLGLIKD
ncbi:hypothetical protein GMD78_13070 [Ornithinibacillus sp. L9]|uniref:RNA polymerase sigma-70 domain-containing protein n=1 Tax=Ornithinibacillus caprae TaxID=2678566 RepID=A0A6N8FIP5_9BACI|nr:sigma factor-like helix-turn-helix DNA-binding protein [Ornithinibacillus caprae]MUK89303.1 hypothetical protein [Ornithinibacillus caprae]